MSTAPKYSTAQSDRFRYGWRYVSISRPDGTEAVEEVPLTLEDVLHPEEGDFILQTDAHNCDRGYLQSTFTARLRDKPTAVLLADCGVDWNISNVRRLCPDIAVFFNVKRHIDGNVERWLTLLRTGAFASDRERPDDLHRRAAMIERPDVCCSRRFSDVRASFSTAMSSTGSGAITRCFARPIPSSI